MTYYHGEPMFYSNWHKRHELRSRELRVNRTTFFYIHTSFEQDMLSNDYFTFSWDRKNLKTRSLCDLTSTALDTEECKFYFTAFVFCHAFLKEMARCNITNRVLADSGNFCIRHYKRLLNANFCFVIIYKWVITFAGPKLTQIDEDDQDFPIRAGFP